ncbi:MAG: Fe(2+)-trafficking protein [Planctomycetota bacterium]
MDIEQRITQFEKLIESDADNDMAHFSLGGAYAQAGRHSDAAASYLTCTELNPTMSKAYQLAGASLIEAGETDGAGDVLTRGYTIAAERGDLMPQKAMGELLERIGKPVPQAAKADASEEPAGSFVCQKTGKAGTQLAKPPFKNAVGTWIYERISKQTFDEWIGLGTKIINELRLDLSRDEHDAVYDYGMRRFIGLDDETYRDIMKSEPSRPDPEFKGVIDNILGMGGELESFGGEMHKSVPGS